MSDEEYEIESSRMTLTIINELHSMGEANLTELAEKMDIPKSTAHIHLNTLCKQNFVVREDGKYRLGLRFLNYGFDIRESIELYHKGKSQVDSVAEETGELVNLMIEENGYGRYIYAQIENDDVELRTDPGRRVHLHTTGLGKAMLAYFDRERVDEIIDKRGLPPDTEKSITDREELFATLKEIRERGFAYDGEEHMRGIGCVAVPLRNEQQVFGALSVSGPINRIQDDSFREQAIEALRDAKGVIELNMEYA